MKKSMKILVTLILLVTVSASLSASSLVRDVSGKENKGITITYNGQVQTLKDGHGQVIYPVIIDGSTYLPVRAVTEMVGADIAWDGSTKTIAITKKDGLDSEEGAVPTDLKPVDNNSSNTTNPTPNTPSTTSSNAGTLVDPVAMGTTFTYDDPYVYDGQNTNARYEIKVTNVEDYSINQVEALGFDIDEDPLVQYVMVTLDLKATNIACKGSYQWFVDQFKPDLWGSKTDYGNSIIGGTDFGFEGSIDRMVEEAANYERTEPGKTYSYEVTGKILLPTYKELNNYLVFQKSQWEEYQDSFVYFKIK